MVKLALTTQRSDRKCLSLGRIFFTFKSETVLDDLIGRHYRDIEQLRDFAVAALSGLNPPISRKAFVWSQRCGCRCGCSPGFFIQGTKEENEATRQKVFYVEIDPKSDEE